MRNGLKYHNNFGYIISLSGALFIDSLPNRDDSSPVFFERRSFAESFFGDMDKVLESDNNPKYLVKKIQEEGADIPKIYIACGESDHLLEFNKDFAAFLEENKVERTFELGPGAHEWDFWDTYIKKAIEWLPTEDKVSGINSGNIGK